MKESLIEKKVCEHAKSLGWLVFKFKTANHRGVPDRIFMRDGIVLFIEFKAKNGKLSKLQEITIRNFQVNKIPTYIVASVEQGKAIFDRIENA